MSKSKIIGSDKYVTILPRLIPGSLNQSNRGCVDWSYSGLIAYGCHNHIIIYDSKSLELVQTLSFHKDVVSKVVWKPVHKISTENSRKSHMTLLSGDNSGTIFVSNVHDKSILSSSPKNGGSVVQLQWCAFPEEKNMFILALFNPDTFILFQEDNLEAKWKLKLNDTVSCFSIYSATFSISVSTPVSIFIYTDFCFQKPPKAILKTITLNEDNGNLNISISGEQSQLATYFPDRGDKPQKSILSAATDVFRVIQGKAQEKLNTTLLADSTDSSFKIRYICYSSCIPNNIFILINANIVLLFNLDTNQIMTRYEDANYIEFMVPSLHFDAFLLCYSSTFAFFVAHKNLFFKNSSSTSWGDSFVNDEDKSTIPHSSNSTMFNYIQMAGIEPIRLGRSMSIFCFASNPSNETEFICITKTGVFILYHLPFVNHPSKSISYPLYPSANIRQFLSQLDSIYFRNINSTDKQQTRKELRCNQRAIIFPLNVNPTCIRVSPPVISNNNRLFHHHAAVGFQDGSIQVYYLPSGVLRRAFTVFSSPVKQLDWLSPTSIITHASISGFNKPEVNIVDTQTGSIFSLTLPNTEKPDTLRSIKVSHNRNYFVLVFNYGQSQLWDAKNLKFLQNILSSTTILQCVDWKMNDLSVSIDDLGSPPSSIELNNSLDDFEEIIKEEVQTVEPNAKKERLFVVDTRGTLRQLLIDGNYIKELSSTQNELGINLITSIASKGDIVMAADSDGSICLYDIRKNISQIYQNKNTQVKNIKFGSGVGNPLTAILFNDSFQIWNYASLSIIKDSKRFTDVTPIDIDWVSNDMSIILYNDGTVQIIDLMKHNYNLDLSKMRLHKHIFTTFNLSNDNYKTLKILLTYNLIYENIFDNNTLEGIITTDINNYDKLTIMSHLQTFHDNYNISIPCETSITKNALNINRILGDECDIMFWYVTDFYIKYYSKCDLTQKSEQIDIDLGCGSLCDINSLTIFYTWKTLHEKNINGRKSTNFIANYFISKWLIYLKQHDECVKLLASLDESCSNFYIDILRAMIIEHFNQFPQINHKIHLHLATKLMSLHRIDESIEILILTGKYMEACVYLLENDRIYLASVLAKLLLNSSDLNLFATCLDKKQGTIIKSPLHIIHHVLYMISANKFDVAIKILFENERIDLAFMLLKACKVNDICLKCENPLIETPLMSDLEKAVQETFSSYIKTLHIVDKNYYIQNKIEE